MERRLLTSPLATSTPFSAPHYSRSQEVAVNLFSYTAYSDSLHPVISSRASNDVQSHRQRIVKEIFDTEHTYISQLHTIIDLFLKPLCVGGLLTQDVVMTIFSNIEGILAVNQELFSCMRHKSLSAAFNNLGPFLKLYSTYANNFQKASSTLQECLRSNSEFSKFVLSQESRPECCSLRLSSLLITPIQRIPRYKLLLNDLVKHTKPTHSDYQKLLKAASQIKEVASHVNEYIRLHENFLKMLAIQNSLFGNSVPGILAPARKFIHEGKLMKICYRKPKERIVFLFSDILIYAKPKIIRTTDQQRHECRCVLPLINSSVTLLKKDHRAPGISAIMKVSNPDTVLLFYSELEDEVRHWIALVQEATRSLCSSYSNHEIGGVEVDSARQTDTLSSQLSSSSKQLLDLGTLTPHTPYPLTATLFSENERSFNFYNYDGQENDDLLNHEESNVSDKDVFISQSNSRSVNQSKCCSIS